MNKLTLKNSKVIIEYNKELKTIDGMELTDKYNEPRFYSKGVRGLQKAWGDLSIEFDDNTTFYGAIQILSKTIKVRSYCAVD